MACDVWSVMSDEWCAARDSRLTTRLRNRRTAGPHSDSTHNWLDSVDMHSMRSMATDLTESKFAKETTNLIEGLLLC